MAENYKREREREREKTFFFVESKTFEFSVEGGGTYFMLRIFERSQDSLHSVFMGKESAKCLLAIVEDLMYKKLLVDLHDPLGMMRKFLFCNWVPIHTAVF